MADYKMHIEAEYEAMHLWIDMAREYSEPIPEPRCHRLMYA